MADREQDSGLLEQVISIEFHTKVTKGGRNLTVAALVAVGDGSGRVGLGYGKAKAVPQAIEKGSKEARKNMFAVSLVGDTIPHRVLGRHKAARVLLVPAAPGTGVKAGHSVRAVLEVAGVRSILTKVYGNTNPLNVAKATINALRELQSPAEIEMLRGVPLRISHPQRGRSAQPAPVRLSQPPAVTAVVPDEEEGEE